MDFDCLGSLILAKKLFPDHVLVRSRIIHPMAYGVYNLYKEYFNFIDPKDLEKEKIEHIIIVDTSSAERVKEYFKYMRNQEPRITIYDHHPNEECNIPGAENAGKNWGANTSYLAKLAMEQGITLTSEEATIALTGIYADTGRLIYENVCRGDLEAAAWLLDMGGSLRLVKSFLETIREDDQLLVLNQLLLMVEKKLIHGHEILLSYLELDENIPGLAPVVEKIMEIENPDAYFAVFFVRKTKTILVITRSQKQRINLHALLRDYGGGGHQLAASLMLRGQEGPLFYEEFLNHLEKSLVPATCAKDVMTTDVFTIHENSSVMDASIYMEKVNHTGLPVLDNQGKISGFIGLRDIMKARRVSQMHAPVSAYMSKNIISSHPAVTMREVERVFFKNHIGHLPIIENDTLIGIVTRWDFLEYKSRRKGLGTEDEMEKTVAALQTLQTESSGTTVEG
jgi:tRNA nucleotidyltransferase (CCA-adding enzyme)